jgi:purine-binding chemotaxis protein CheW
MREVSGAARLADSPPGTASSAPGVARVVVARLGAERLAFDLTSVSEVLDAPVVSRLPLAPPGLAGQLEHRGGYLPVLDPAVVLGVPRRDGAGAALVLVSAPVALWVDDAEDVWEVSESMRQPVPAGSDAVGILRGLLVRDGQVVSHVDAGALAAAALATLRQGSES